MKQLCYLLLLTVLPSCQTEKTSGEVEIISISNLQKVPAIPYTDPDIIKEYRLILPELTDESMLSGITAIEIEGDKIFIFDQTAARLQVFTFDGTYLYDIGRKGPANGEYTAISGFFINSVSATIHIIDPMTNDVLNYTLDGTFLGKTKHQNAHLNFMKQAAVIGDNLLFCYYTNNWQDEQSMYNILDLKTFDIVENIKNYPANEKLWHAWSYSKHAFHVYDDAIIFTTVYSDTLAVYNRNTGVSPQYKAAHKKVIPSELLKAKYEEFENQSSDVYLDLLRGGERIRQVA